jgi:nitroreductase
MDLVSAITKRHSVRRYAQKKVSREIVRQVLDAGNNAPRLWPAIDIRWYTVWDGRVVTRQLGTQDSGVLGAFLSAPHYILAATQRRPGYMENLGFCMEHLILAATSLGLGTCWIGALSVGKNLREFAPDLASDELIVALTPLGYPDTSQRAILARRLRRWGTSPLGDRRPLSETVSRDIWSVPWTGEDEMLHRVLELTRLAPSWSNGQPWHFVVDDQQVLIAIDRTSPQGDVAQAGPYRRLDGGIAMCHFALAARAAGLQGRWRVPEAAESKMLRDRYAIPSSFDVLGVYPLLVGK